MLEALLMVLGMVDLDSILKMLVDNGIFAMLFGFMLWDTRTDARSREERLNKQIDKQDEALDKIAVSIDRIENRLQSIDKKKTTAKKDKEIK